MADFQPVFDALRGILAPFASELVVKTDTAQELYLDTRHIQRNRQPLFFGAVRLGKTYVSYYLMPVYVRPDLLASVSPALRKRMQGKSCFNFKTVDPELVRELAELTRAGFESYRKQGYV